MEVTDKFETCSEGITYYYRDFDGDLENKVLETMLASTLREEFFHATTYDINRELPMGNFFFHPNLGSVSHHVYRCHLLQDIYCYNFLAKFIQEGRTPPKIDNYYASGIFNDRFRGQRCNDAATTILSYTSTNGYYFNHFKRVILR